MEYYKNKKTIINSSEIVILGKKGDITIKLEEIEMLEYTKPTFINFFLDSGYPGYLRIYLNKTVNNSKSYLVRIKYNDVQKLPAVYLKMIYPT